MIASRASRKLLESRVFAARQPAAFGSAMQQQQGPRGAFILFEGVDRCGKSTQTSLLAKALANKGVAVESWNFPDRKNTVTGHAINEYLAGKQDHNDRAIHLLFSANRWEKSDALLRALQSGTNLVVDRYAYSGVAYSAAKGLAGVDAAWCKAPDAGLPAPDLVVYLELDNAAAAARAGFGGERYERADFQDKVRAVFQQLKEPNWLVVDASQTMEQIHEQILAEALQVIRQCREGQP
ncbi:thymidylate kinase-domain-containing protein [Scenedesmus sp. NREL 46B-D3]|nr:thymidylate kinase-domain-containing protein [Scenedesmus sp. NREL 46B-D3]